MFMSELLIADKMMWLSLKCALLHQTLSLVKVSTHSGPSSRARGVSSRALSTRAHPHGSPCAEMFTDQPESLSPTLDDMESFSSTPSTSYHQSATQEIKNVDQLISMFLSRVPMRQIQTLYQLSGLRISLDNNPALDTGGVRRQVYTCVYNKFISNKCVHLLEGPENHNRTFYSAESRGSGFSE